MNGFDSRRLAMPGAWRMTVVVTLLGIAAGGCKMGSAGTKPSWWTFGGASKPTAEALAAAPTFNGGVEKPSATATPYPTTATPNGYAIGDSRPPTAGPTTAAAPAAVTYGVTPPPPKNDPVELATAAARPAGTGGGTAAGGSMASIVPQVGAYSSLPADPAGGAGLSPPPLASMPAAAVPATGSSFDPPPQAVSVAEPMLPQRMADARAATAWPDAPPAAGSRYGDGASSRFGVAVAPSEAAPSSLPAALEPLPPTAAPAAAGGLAPSAGGFAPPPSAAPPAGYPPPAPALPPSSPPGPVRRPDPLYRPGGTSSYQPNRAILAGEAEADEPPIRTVGFDAPGGESR